MQRAKLVLMCLILGVWSGISCSIGYFVGQYRSEKVVETVETVKYIKIYFPYTPEPTIESLGEFTATAYCCENYPHICNDGDATTTATGTTPTAGRTIAVDPDVIPYGTEIIIDGHTYIAEDTGESIQGNRVDILFPTHEEALLFGKRKVELFVVNDTQ